MAGLVGGHHDPARLEVPAERAASGIRSALCPRGPGQAPLNPLPRDSATPCPHRDPAARQEPALPGELAGQPGRTQTMNEVPVVVGDADARLRERLDEEIYAFNAAVTGHRDGRSLSAQSAGTTVTCVRGSTAGRGVGAATSNCSGCETTSAVPAWEPGSSPQARLRSGAAAATRWSSAPTRSRRPVSMPGSATRSAAAHPATRVATTKSTC